jgi:MOSC domain-containing protein YiiM
MSVGTVGVTGHGGENRAVYVYQIESMTIGNVS